MYIYIYIYIYIHDFQQLETITSFGDSIYPGKINIDETDIDPTNLLGNMVKSNNRSRPRSKMLIEMHMLFMKVQN